MNKVAALIKSAPSDYTSLSINGLKFNSQLLALDFLIIKIIFFIFEIER